MAKFRLTLSFSEIELELYMFLKSKHLYSRYVKELIKKDMKKENKNNDR